MDLDRLVANDRRGHVEACLAAERAADRAERAIELGFAIGGVDAEALLRAEHASRQRGELGRERFDRAVRNRRAARGGGDPSREVAGAREREADRLDAR